MWIVALAWIYVVGLMALTEPSIVAGIMTFFAYCVLPLSIIYYLSGARRRAKTRSASAHPTGHASAPHPPGADPAAINNPNSPADASPADASSVAVLATVQEPCAPAGPDCASTFADGIATASFGDAASACAAPAPGGGGTD